MDGKKRQEALSGRDTHTVEEAAARLGISRSHAYELIRRGEFPVQVIRLGRRLVVPKAALNALLQATSESGVAGADHEVTERLGRDER